MCKWLSLSIPYNDQTVKYTLFADDTTVSLSAEGVEGCQVGTGEGRGLVLL